MLDGKVSNKDRPKHLSQSLFIGFSLLEMSNLKRKGILDLPTLRYLCAILFRARRKGPNRRPDAKSSG